MTLKEKFQKAWENRSEIAGALYNTYISSDAEIKEESARRRSICESNVCGYYDTEGKPENSVIPGKPSCSICMCNIVVKSNCRNCWCALKDINQSPLWEEMTTADQEKELNETIYYKQFEKNE